MNSSLVSYTKLVSSCNSPRNHVIDTVTIHVMAGINESLETFGSWLEEARYSSNYAIDSNGRIGLFVDEGNRSWCSSSPANDHRAITIEVANSDGEPDWPISDKAYAALVNLLTDICKRNGIKRLLWKGDKSLIGKVEQQNMTVHRWFANKACPGDYLYNRYADIALRVNTNLEEDDMEGKDIYDKLNAYLATLPTSDYAKESSKKGVESGLFSDGDKDGLVDNPRGILTRQDLAVVLNRAGTLDK